MALYIHTIVLYPSKITNKSYRVSSSSIFDRIKCFSQKALQIPECFTVQLININNLLRLHDTANCCQWWLFNNNEDHPKLVIVNITNLQRHSEAWDPKIHFFCPQITKVETKKQPRFDNKILTFHTFDAKDLMK